MTCTLKTALVILMLALVPIRALAAATTGFCAFAHEHGAAAHHGATSQDPHDREAPAPSPDGSPCGSCVAHCSSAAFAPSSPAAGFAGMPATERCTLDECAAVDFIPDHLDPPPLAS